MKTIKSFLFFWVMLLLLIQKTNAQPGTLDTSFGKGGVVSYDTMTDNSDALIQPDGKIVELSSSFHGYSIKVRRFNPDGTFDSTFGIYGQASIVFPGFLLPHNIAIQEDGKIVFTGDYLSNGHTNVGITRCNVDGSIDSSFGNNGFDTIFLDNITFATGLAIQQDGKIVVSGDLRKNIYDDERTFISRRLPNGGPDPSFGNEGNVVNHYNVSINSIALLIRPNGKLVIGSTFNTFSEHASYMLASFNPDGSVNSSFGENGIAQYIFGEGQSETWNSLMESMALQPDGKIVCVGISGTDDPLMAICRFNEDGTTDLGFGENGSLITPYLDYHNMYVNDVAIQPDGKIVTSGVSWKWSYTPFTLLLTRYTSDGHLDPVFGKEGISAIDTPSGMSANHVFILPDGKIFTSGAFDGPIICMARFNGGDNVLASNFKEVKAIQENEAITITWQTLNENNTKSFTVERSNNAKDFVGISTIPAKHAAGNNYSYTDKNPLYGDNYYRIKENAANGTNTYSQTLKVNFENNNIISLYPNPAKNTVTIKGLDKNATAVIKITDMNGREISKQNFSNTSSTTLSIRALAQGSYFVLVEQNGKVTKLRMMKE